MGAGWGRTSRGNKSLDAGKRQENISGGRACPSGRMNGAFRRGQEECSNAAERRAGRKYGSIERRGGIFAEVGESCVIRAGLSGGHGFQLSVGAAQDVEAVLKEREDEDQDRTKSPGSLGQGNAVARGGGMSRYRW